jgi:hypothetical protein
MYGAGPARDVHFFIRKVLPDTLQGFQQFFLACLRIHVGGAAVQIAGSDGMSDYLIFFAQGNARLVLVAPARLGTTHIHEDSGQFEMLFITCYPVQLHNTHDVRRIESEVRQVLRSRLEDTVQIIGGLDGNIQ